MTPTPCRICGCTDNEACLCHAVTPNGLACYRVKPDWCSACGTWNKEMRQRNPLAPIEALAAAHRAERADAAAAKRGTSVPGAFALRVHAARMRRKARQFAVDAGVVEAPPEKPVKERDTPLCP